MNSLRLQFQQIIESLFVVIVHHPFDIMGYPLDIMQHPIDRMRHPFHIMRNPIHIMRHLIYMMRHLLYIMRHPLDIRRTKKAFARIGTFEHALQNILIKLESQVKRDTVFKDTNKT